MINNILKEYVDNLVNIDLNNLLKYSKNDEIYKFYMHLVFKKLQGLRLHKKLKLLFLKICLIY